MKLQDEIADLRAQRHLAIRDAIVTTHKSYDAIAAEHGVCVATVKVIARCFGVRRVADKAVQ